MDNFRLNEKIRHSRSHRLNLYIYEYLYHIGAAKAAQGFCADVSDYSYFLILLLFTHFKMKWEPTKMSLGEPPGFLLSWWW